MVKIGDSVILPSHYNEVEGVICATSGTDETCLARYGQDHERVTSWMPMSAVEVIHKEKVEA